MNTIVKDLGHVMEFSAISMYEVHSIQNDTIEEMKTKEHLLVNRVKSSHKTIKKLKNTI